jgi:hypothetical protein
MVTIILLAILILASPVKAQIIYPTDPRLILASYNENNGNYDLNSDNLVNNLDLGKYYLKKSIYIDLPNSARNISCNEACQEYSDDQGASFGLCLSVGLNWISGANDGLYWQLVDQQCQKNAGATCDMAMVTQGDPGMLCGPHVMQEYRPMWTNCHCEVIL